MPRISVFTPQIEAVVNLSFADDISCKRDLLGAERSSRERMRQWCIAGSANAVNVSPAVVTTHCRPSSI